MDDLLTTISKYVELGKADLSMPYPPEFVGKEGVAELTEKALANNVKPTEILAKSLIPGMERIGKKFRNQQVFLPEVLMAARAMAAGMDKLRPFFNSGEIKHKGKIILGTVEGDLHDIGKNIVSMFFEGAGWKVIDLGIDVNYEEFLKAIEEFQPEAIGLSALLTTTMSKMKETTQKIREDFPDIKVLIGGAPITQKFADEIGAHGYFSDPQSALEYLS